MTTTPTPADEVRAAAHQILTVIATSYGSITVGDVSRVTTAYLDQAAHIERLTEALDELSKIGLDCIQNGSNENRLRLLESVEWSMGLLKDLAAETADREAQL